MAKKGKSKANSDANKSGGEPRDTLSSAPSQASISGEEPAVSPVPTPTGAAPKDLQEALALIQSLKVQLAQKDEEIATLKAAATTRPLSNERSEQLSDLQEKLRRLRKEQQDADAAKDAAWRQLKAVVVEISKLAAPPS